MRSDAATRSHILATRPARFFDQLSERLAALPGVRAVSAASQFPPSASFSIQFRARAGTVQRADAADVAGHRRDARLLRDAARALCTPGRGHRPSDRLGTPRVAIDQPGVCRAVSRWRRSASGNASRSAAPIVHGPLAHHRRCRLRLSQQRGRQSRPPGDLSRPSVSRPTWNQLFVLVRTDGSPSALLSSVRETVSALDPEQPVYMIQTLDEALATSSFQQRISAVLLSIFAGVALVLGRHRHLRRDVVCRDRPHAGDGRAPGARRAAPRRDVACPWPGAALVGDRPGARHRDPASQWTPARASAVRRPASDPLTIGLLRSCWLPWRSSRRGPQPRAPAGSTRFSASRPNELVQGSRFRFEQDRACRTIPVHRRTAPERQTPHAEPKPELNEYPLKSTRSCPAGRSSPGSIAATFSSSTRSTVRTRRR